jgi:transcriptional regulator with XRE-family HTH domain
MSETFGQMLRRLRIERALSQSALARRAGCDPGYVNRMERGTQLRQDGRVTIPDRTIVLALAEVLDISQAEADRLLYAAGLAPQADYQTRAEAAEAKLDLIRQTFDLTPDVLLFPRRRPSRAGTSSPSGTTSSA